MEKDKMRTKTLLKAEQNSNLDRKHETFYAFARKNKKKLSVTQKRHQELTVSWKEEHKSLPSINNCKVLCL